jgi:uncharacterized protein YfaS (alpha-2-macroglobulin family)
MKYLPFSFFGASLIALIFLTCGFQNTQTQQMLSYPNDDYEKEWKSIDSLERQGLPRSAMEKVEELYLVVKKEDNVAQVVKCLLYKSKYTNQLEEDGLAKAITALQNELAEAEFPLKPLMQSVLGETYIRYLDNNYWKLRNRTATSGELPEDFLTWSPQQITQESRRLMLASVQDNKTMKIDISDFTAITTNERNTEGLQPTLYDFLAHRCLQTLSNDRSYLPDPAYKFYITDPAAFAPAKTFAKHAFTAQDEESAKFQALKIYQQLIAFHINDNDPAALIDADIQRLRFVYENGVYGDKDKLYEEALKSLTEKYEAQDMAAEIYFYLASLYANQGDSYKPQSPDETFKWKRKEAVELCAQTIDQYPDTYGAKHCQNLKTRLLQKGLDIKTEEVNSPKTPFLALVEYQNIDRVYFRLIAMDEDKREKLDEMRYNQRLDYIRKLDAPRKWSVDIPNDGDLHRHTLEVKVDGLPFGQYLLVASDDKDMRQGESNTAYLFTHISNLGYWSRSSIDRGHDYFLADRNTGEPIEGAKMDVFIRKRGLIGGERWSRVQTKTTDKDGFVKMDVQENQYFQIQFSKGEDKLHLQDGYYSYSYRNRRNRDIQMNTSFFMDRTIYRPGQTIYFKGVVLQKNEYGVPSIVKDREVEITLFDANYQKVDSKTLRTNRFGTVNGSFIAPQGGLLGQMSLHSNIGADRQFFRVEEYKRPRFEVTFKPVEGSYRFDEEVTITGEAQLYAGAPVDGAKVKFRVVRQTRFPWWYRWWFPPSPSEEMEIANGFAETQADGTFDIDFTLIPDRSISADRKPQFVYRVYADVTDITGETQSGETSVSAGYIALKVDIPLASEVNRDKLTQLEIKTENLNGQFEPAEGTLEIARLKEPANYYRDRNWQKPDQFVMNREEFMKAFPHDAWKNEDRPEEWETLKKVLETGFNTAEEKALELKAGNWPIGHYRLTLNTQDAFGEKVELIKHFTLFDLDEKEIPYGEIQSVQLKKDKWEPGEKAEIQLATTEKESYFLVEWEFRDDIVKREWVKVRKPLTISYPLEEKHRGGLHCHVRSFHFGRHFADIPMINVPWSNKELSFEYMTFRDKLRPGDKEEWRIKISGPQKEAVAAEMAATMYDASLDAFAPHNWSWNLYPGARVSRTMSAKGFGNARAYELRTRQYQYVEVPSRVYRQLNWFGFYPMYQDGVMLTGARNRSMGIGNVQRFGAEPEAQALEELVVTDGAAPTEKAMAYDSADMAANEESAPMPPSPEDAEDDQGGSKKQEMPIRRNLNETVFFFPTLTTDKEGNVVLKFTMNEALTRWKFLAVAHTEDLKYGLTEKEVVTQKELMVLPNAPRFIREGDQLEFTAKVNNLTEEVINGTAQLELLDAITMKPVNKAFGLANNEIPFKAEGKQSDRLAWNIKVPQGKTSALIYQVTVRSGQFADGEENALPVLTNRMLVTESKPLAVRGKEKKKFVFESMEKASQSSSLQHHGFTLEFTSNPAWYAVQAIPYLMEYPYECTEQIFNRFYANSLATGMANSHPRIKQVFDQWRTLPEDQSSSALLSNLSKNQELKSAILEETPWVLDAQSEEQQKKNIALLFDLNRMANEQAQALAQLEERQAGNGGFAWFPGGRESWYITQYVVEGLGHLDRLLANQEKLAQPSRNMLERAIRFTDAQLLKHYRDLEDRVQRGYTKWEDDHLDNMAIHYLYARSFFPNQQRPDAVEKAFTYYLGQAEKYWLNKGMYQEGMLALALKRYDKEGTAQKIVRSLKERALTNEELGMYWKYPRGYFWFQHPIETHALMVEVFAEVANDDKAVEELRIWLLKNKQTNHWKTTKATAAAAYALLMNGANWLLEDEPVSIKIGGKKLDMEGRYREAGTGYFKESWQAADVSKDLAKIEVDNPNSHIAWGAAYWQYFEDLDKITTFEETPLTIKKQLFRERNTDRGPVMDEVTEEMKLEPGDQLNVRIEIRVDRPMEYVHMKDMRASGLEPLNVLSQYKWQGGLGYYESTRDASTNFFIEYLPQGTYVFEYPLVVSHKGDFSNGITSIQCMYAPEFSSHSEGIRISIQ